MTQAKRLVELERLILETAERLKATPARFKRFDPEDRMIIRAEEKGYDILAAALIEALRTQSPGESRD